MPRSPAVALRVGLSGARAGAGIGAVVDEVARAAALDRERPALPGRVDRDLVAVRGRLDVQAAGPAQGGLDPDEVGGRDAGVAGLVLGAPGLDRLGRGGR